MPKVHDRLGMPARWYDFSLGEFRFIVLDGNDVSTFAPALGDPRRELAKARLEALCEAGALNAQDWNGSFSNEQLSWLRATLAKADAMQEQVVLFCHYPLYPANAHNMWDAPEVLKLLAAHHSVRAWFCGHNHDGNYGVIGNTHFVNVKGMVDTPDQKRLCHRRCLSGPHRPAWLWPGDKPRSDVLTSRSYGRSRHCRRSDGPVRQLFSPLAMGAKETEKAKFRYLIFLWKIT